MNAIRLLTTTAMLLVASATANAAPVTIDMVTVGNSQNTADTTGYGAVNYEYRIGKYEVTIAQYCAFLNAAAKSDPYGLYDARMGTDLRIAGIARTGSAGSYTYTTMSNSGNSDNRPITYVSWFDAARFANWMHNGQGGGSTETGAYTLVDGQPTGSGSIAPAMNPGAMFYIPTENEWYKAAYYSPLLNLGSGGYYLYATQSNAMPGNTIGNGANQANYILNDLYSVTQSATYSTGQNYLTSAGAFSGSQSFYGTFDQSGNVYELNSLDGAAGVNRGMRGGSWGSASFLGTAFDLSTSQRIDNVDGAYAGNSFGFRLASPVAVPEPSTWAMAACGVACAAWGAWRRRKAAA